MGPLAPNSAMTVPSRRVGVTSRIRREHHAGVAELQPDQHQAQRELPRLATQRDGTEHDRLDQGAADDDRLAAVLVGPDAPQRDERRAHHEHE